MMLLKKTWKNIFQIDWMCSGSGKTNSFNNLINKQPDIDKIYLYAKDLHKEKYQFLINKRKSTRLKHFNDSKTFIEYSNDL